MTMEEFRRRAVEHVLAQGHSVERIEWHGEREADFHVLEGGYEPARLRVVELDGEIKSYFK